MIQQPRVAADTLSTPMPRSRWRWLTAALAIIVIAAGVEFAMGRVPICRCGYVKLWHGVVSSSENSQHLTDWYTFSHVIHGIGFYALLWLVARRLPAQRRFVLAVLLEAAWEVFENTPFVINRYRAARSRSTTTATASSTRCRDIVAMMVGFWLARRGSRVGERPSSSSCSRSAWPS